MATWERLAHVALSGTADTISSGTISAYENLKVTVFGIGSGALNTNIRFNADSGYNYAWRCERDGNGSDDTSTSQAEIAFGGGANVFIHCNITNIASKEKLLEGNKTTTTAGAGNAPDRREQVGKWVNTSSNITSIQAVNTGSGDFAAGSYITVWGANPAPVTADVITVDGLEAKKYLMVQYKIVADGTLDNIAAQFNNDTGNNYAYRVSVDGSADSTVTSNSKIRFRFGSAVSNDFFGTLNIINESTKEKLVINDQIRSNTAGAGNAPSRAENVAKWANTSNQITRVDIIQDGSGSFTDGSEITVYGTD